MDIPPPEPMMPPAQKQRRDMRAMWRVSAWGCGAAIALAALAITTQTEVGGERLKLALGTIDPPSAVAELTELKQRVLDKDQQARRLEVQVATLAADRDRLATRLASLERNLEDMTGSIKQQATLAAEAAVTRAATPPTLSPLANVSSVSSVTSVRTESFTPPPSDTPVQAAAPSPEPVPLPPTRVAVAAEAAVDAPRKTEFGVDLGGAPTMEVLNARWAAVKANFGPLLAGLRPLAARDRRPGTIDLRLLAGPVANPAAGAALCARFAAVRVTCRTAKFDGEQLAQR
jgi:hypothetical protein